MSIKIQECSQKLSLSIKIQDFPEQNLDFKRDPRMGEHLEIQDLKEYQFISFPNNQCHNHNLSYNLSPFPPQKLFIH